MASKPDAVGSILWTDLTVPNAEELRAFYVAVVGWTSEPVSMGQYDDFNMLPPGRTEPVAGICHARGPNKHLPAQWLVYISVASIDESVRRCKERGGTVVDGPRSMGEKRFCVIRDPAGAVIALMGD